MAHHHLPNAACSAHIESIIINISIFASEISNISPKSLILTVDARSTFVAKIAESGYNTNSIAKLAAKIGVTIWGRILTLEAFRSWTSIAIAKRFVSGTPSIYS